MRKFSYIYGPSIVMAIVAEIVFFAVINPKDLYLFGEPVHWSPVAVYSVGFLLFWALTASTVALSLFMQQSPEDVDKAAREHRLISH